MTTVLSAPGSLFSHSFAPGVKKFAIFCLLLWRREAEQARGEEWERESCHPPSQRNKRARRDKQVFGAVYSFFTFLWRPASRGQLLAVELGCAQKNPGRQRRGTGEKCHGNLLVAKAGARGDKHVFGATLSFFILQRERGKCPCHSNATWLQNVLNLAEELDCQKWHP